jgi:capsular exopolysaccharide synthesis family protein
MSDININLDRPFEASRERRHLLAGAPTARQTSLLMHYWRMIMRRRMWILGSILVALVIGVIVTLLMTPMYTAVTRIDIQRQGDNIVRIQGVEAETGAAEIEFYQTQYGLLQGRYLAEDVARELDLGNNPGFFEAFDQAALVGEQFANGRPIRNDQQSREQRNAIAAKILLQNVEIEPQRLSRLVDIVFTSPDPNLSARVANQWATSFVETSLERRYDATSYAREFLERRLEQIRARLEDSERQLVTYASQQRIVNLPSNVASTSGSGADRPLLVDNLAQLNTELTAATADRVQAESRLRTTRAATPESLGNTTVNQLRTSLAQAEADYAKLLTQFEPEYPEAQALAAQIEDLRGSLRTEEARVGSSVTSNYQEALRREQGLRQQVDELQSGLLDLRRRSIQYNIYQRDVDTNRGLYDSLLQRYKEIGVAAGVGINNVSVVDTAEVPGAPSSPIIWLNLGVALVFGTLLGCGIALVFEQLDETISDPNDVPKVLGLPLLGTVPQLPKDEDPVEATQDPKSSLVEAYLSIQTNLEFATDHGAPYTIAVTSSRPAEGKSTTAFTLAKLLARAGRKVVLVDGDMRSPSVNGLLNLSNEYGLSNYLAGNAQIEQLLQEGDTPGMAVMAAGPKPPNAAELLAGSRLTRLLVELRERFDHVVIDAPPVMGLADAPILTGHVEGVLFAIQANATSINLMKSALLRLEAAHAPVIGAVLTKFAEKNAYYGYGYGYNYGSAEKPA